MILIIIKKDTKRKRCQKALYSGLLNKVKNDAVTSVMMDKNKIITSIIKSFTADIEYICTKYGVKL